MLWISASPTSVWLLESKYLALNKMCTAGWKHFLPLKLKNCNCIWEWSQRRKKVNIATCTCTFFISLMHHLMINGARNISDWVSTECYTKVKLLFCLYTMDYVKKNISHFKFKPYWFSFKSCHALFKIKGDLFFLKHSGLKSSTVHTI